MRFFKDQNYYKSIKISTREARGMVVSIDMQLEEMLRESNKIFDSFIENVDLVKNISGQLASLTTDIEHDQTDEKHFNRIGGIVQSTTIDSLNNLKQYVEKVDRNCHKYFDICERIRNLMFLRNSIVKKCMNDVGIEKLKTEVQLTNEVNDTIHSNRTETM
jgi:hypothetical protein